MISDLLCMGKPEVVRYVSDADYLGREYVRSNYSDSYQHREI